MRTVIMEYGEVLMLIGVGVVLIRVLTGLLNAVINPEDMGWFFEFFS